MTVADNTSRNQYTATSGQTVFAYTFEIVDKNDIVVLKDGVTLSEGADYTVSNVGNDNGGNVTLTTGASTGEVLTLYRDMPYARTQNYTNSGDFLASDVNSDFDNLWLAGEQTNRAFSQSIRKPVTDSDSISMELPAASSRADKLLGFSATGAVQASSSDLLNVTATSTELNVLDGITATTAELNYVDGVTSNIQTQLDAKMPLAGGTFSGSVTYADNARIRIGTSNDLDIYHDGSNSYIIEQGTGSLFVKSNGAGIVFRDAADANYISMLQSTGEAKLFHISGGSATQRLATSSVGIDVNGSTETDKLRITTSSAPSSASDTGTVGEIAWDTNYIYVCVGTNTWKRVAISTW